MTSINNLNKLQIDYAVIITNFCSAVVIIKLIDSHDLILRYVCLAKSNKEISHEMGICDGTVKVHLHTIFSELGVDNRIQAARLLGA